MAAGFDKDIGIKKQAGSQKLNAYTNYYALQTLCDFLNCNFEQVLNSDDTFCTKVLVSNLEKTTFEKRFIELKQKQKKK